MAVRWIKQTETKQICTVPYSGPSNSSSGRTAPALTLFDGSFFVDSLLAAMMNWRLTYGRLYIIFEK